MSLDSPALLWNEDQRRWLEKLARRGNIRQDRDAAAAALAEIARLTTVVNDAARERALVIAVAGENALQRELLDLMTLMPDSQTQAIIDYILELRAIRQRRDAPSVR